MIIWYNVYKVCMYACVGVYMSLCSSGSTIYILIYARSGWHLWSRYARIGVRRTPWRAVGLLRQAGSRCIQPCPRWTSPDPCISLIAMCFCWKCVIFHLCPPSWRIPILEIWMNWAEKSDFCRHDFDALKLNIPGSQVMGQSESGMWPMDGSNRLDTSRGTRVLCGRSLDSSLRFLGPGGWLVTWIKRSNARISPCFTRFMLHEGSDMIRCLFSMGCLKTPSLNSTFPLHSAGAVMPS